MFRKFNEYKRIEDLVFEKLKESLKDFSESENNKDIYAAALVFGNTDTGACLKLKIGAKDLYGIYPLIYEVKYGCEKYHPYYLYDMHAFEDSYELNGLIDEYYDYMYVLDEENAKRPDTYLTECYWEGSKNFNVAMRNVMSKLKDKFLLLNITNDFVSYYCPEEDMSMNDFSYFLERIQQS